MEKLKDLREENFLYQKDMAKILNIKRSTYTSYEIGRDQIPIKHLNKLCQYFNISIDYAFGLTSTKNYENNRPTIVREKTAERLKELRLEYELTQEDIAKELNTSRSTWTGYEYGKYQIPALFLYAIAKKYHYSIDYLLGKIDYNPLKK